MSEANLNARRRFVASVLSTPTLAVLPAHSTTDAQVQKMKGEEMTILTPYLLFEGNCHHAMEFYKSCFGGELALTKVKDSPAKNHMPAVQQDKVLNARLRSSNGDLGIGLAALRSNCHSRQYGLSFLERWDNSGVGSFIRETIQRCGSH